jgi:hypothetical protein
MDGSSPDGLTVQPRRGVKQLLKSYFYWTYPRGCFHYDVMVTLILLFIFIAPRFWNFGDRPSPIYGPSHPIQIVGNGGRGLIITVEDADANIPPYAEQDVVRRALRKAIEPVTGDAVFVEHWETFTDAEGNLMWKVWAHR